MGLLCLKWKVIKIICISPGSNREPTGVITDYSNKTIWKHFCENLFIFHFFFFFGIECKIIFKPKKLLYIKCYSCLSFWTMKSKKRKFETNFPWGIWIVNASRTTIPCRYRIFHYFQYVSSLILFVFAATYSVLLRLVSQEEKNCHKFLPVNIKMITYQARTSSLPVVVSLSLFIPLHPQSFLQI